MAGSNAELGRDLVAEVIAARKTPVRTPEEIAREERVAFRLFSALTDFTRELNVLPPDQLPELSPLSDNLTKAERNEQLSIRGHQQFMTEIARRNEISRADHFLDAIIEKDGETVRAQIQLQPGRGDVSLEAPAAFKISLPDSTIDDVLTVREKSIQGDSKVVTRLLSYLRYPTTQVSYRRQSRTSSNS